MLEEEEEEEEAEEVVMRRSAFSISLTKSPISFAYAEGEAMIITRLRRRSSFFSQPSLASCNRKTAVRSAATNRVRVRWRITANLWIFFLVDRTKIRSTGLDPLSTSSRDVSSDADRGCHRSKSTSMSSSPSLALDGEDDNDDEDAECKGARRCLA